MNKLVSIKHSTLNFTLFKIVFCLSLAYGFASLAIDRGSLWWYLLTIYFFIKSIQNVYGLFIKRYDKQ
ncbi:MAG TPA: hypothetical protein VLF63_00880 [Patescibacteria group bacterium]|nr:hypothetical protein [Patescibacteria group bacterium]